VMNLSVGNVGFILHTAIGKLREQLVRDDGSALRQIGRTS
jgi:hypothetical protein